MKKNHTFAICKKIITLGFIDKHLINSTPTTRSMNESNTTGTNYFIFNILRLLHRSMTSLQRWPAIYKSIISNYWQSKVLTSKSSEFTIYPFLMKRNFEIALSFQIQKYANALFCHYIVHMLLPYWPSIEGLFLLTSHWFFSVLFLSLQIC